jgi:hypothetical protein
LFVFDEDIGRFNIAMHKIFGGEVVASGDDLSGEIVDFLLVPVEIVLLDILLEIALAILEEKVKIICGFLHI